MPYVFHYRKKQKLTTLSELCCYLAVCLLVVYSFFGTLIAQIMGGMVVYFIIFVSELLSVFSVLYGNRLRFNTKIIKKFTGWIVCSLFFVLSRNVMFEHGSYLVTFLFVWSLTVAIALAHNSSVCGKVLKIILICASVHMIATLFFLLFPLSYSYMLSIWGYWPSGTLGGKAGYRSGILNHYSANALVIAVGLLATSSVVFTIAGKSIKKLRRLYVFLMFFFFLSLMITTKRAHLIFALIAIIVIYYFAFPNMRTNKMFKIIAAILVFLGAFIGLADIIPVIGATLDRILGIGLDQSSGERVMLWKIALRLFTENPFLGIGWGGFRYEYYQSLGSGSLYTRYAYLDAHNVYLQLLAETGIVGFVIFMWAMFTTLRWGYKLVCKVSDETLLDAENRSYLLYALAMQVFFLLYCLTGNCFYDTTICHYAISVGIIVGISCKKSNIINGATNINEAYI